MKTLKRMMTALMLVALLALAVVGPAATAGAAKGGSPGEVHLALRAPKGTTVTFQTPDGEITLSGNRNVKFMADRSATIVPIAVTGAGDLYRIHAPHAAGAFINEETGLVAVTVAGKAPAMVRYVYR